MCLLNHGTILQASLLGTHGYMLQAASTDLEKACIKQEQQTWRLLDALFSEIPGCQLPQQPGSSTAGKQHPLSLALSDRCLHEKGRGGGPPGGRGGGGDFLRRESEDPCIRSCHPGHPDVQCSDYRIGASKYKRANGGSGSTYSDIGDDADLVTPSYPCQYCRLSLLHSLPCDELCSKCLGCEQARLHLTCSVTSDVHENRHRQPFTSHKIVKL